MSVHSKIFYIKNQFLKTLSEKLNLEKVEAPLFLENVTGLNDDLNGVKRKVEFTTKCGKECSIVQSLGKWKRYALYNLKKECNSGIITDMRAVRKDEDLSSIHSYYVDQWDWEMVISKEDRKMETLISVVKKIYSSIRHTEYCLSQEDSEYSVVTPEDIHIVSSQELEDAYPDSTPKEREYICAKQHGAIFITHVGKVLKSGTVHDMRAPDYDDWEMNGDIILYYEPLDIALEVSSMGIRVSEESLKSQLEYSGCVDRSTLMYHKMILTKQLPYTIGGGIGQSRLAMFLLKKRHIGEVQVSVWDAPTMAENSLDILK